MNLEEIQGALILLGGELIGNSGFFIEIFSGKRQGTAEEKRKLILMPFFSIFISLAAIAGVTALPMAADILLGLCVDTFPGSEAWLLAVKKRVLDLCSLDVFSSFSYITAYIAIYSFSRKIFKKIAITIGNCLLRAEDEFMGIYVRDSFGTKYVLSQRWEMIYHCICVLIVLDMCLMALTHVIYSSAVKSIINVEPFDMIPCMVLMILIEAAGYLSAKERTLWQWLKKRRHKQAADCSLNMIRLESAMEKYAAGTGNNILKRMRCHQYDFPNRLMEYIESRRTEEDASVQYLLDYLERESVSRNIPMHTVDAAIRLVKGENLFVANFFYRDLDVSIFFPIFMALLKGEKALILAEDNGNLEEIADWVREGIEGIQDLTDFWTVEELRPMADSVDVGVLAFQEICKGEQLTWCSEFLDRVSFVAILEASDLLAAGQDIIMSLSSKIGRKMDNCTWMLVDRNAESVVDLYSHLLDREFLYVSATPYYAKETLITYWNTEKEDGRPWFPHKRYLGTEAALAGIALKEKIGKLHWYGEEMMPVKDLYWIWGQYYEKYHQYVQSGEPYQMRIDENIGLEVAGSGSRLREQQFIITEDECFNLFEKGRQFATRGIDKVCVCILSPNYILRDYMKANYQILEKDPKYIPQFTVEHVDSKRNIALRIVRRLLEEPVSYTELRNTLNKLEETEVGAERMQNSLRKQVKLIMPDLSDVDIIVTHVNRFSEQNLQIEREEYYRIVDEEVKRRFRVYFSQAVYLDETGNSRHISRMILGDHLDQKYVKGQFVVFDGKYYEIMGKTLYNGAKALRVKRASDQIYGRKYYRNLREYEMSFSSDTMSREHSCSGQDAVYKNRYYSIVQKTADTLTAETIGYVESDDLGRIKGAKEVRWGRKKQRDDMGYQRTYNQKQVLKVRVEQGDKKSTLIMAAFMKEIFCTLYPQHYHLLDVAVDYNIYGKMLNNELRTVISRVQINNGTGEVEASGTGKTDMDTVFFIIEDSREDMGLLRSIERNILKILDIQYDYMKWSIENGRNYFRYE